MFFNFLSSLRAPQGRSNLLTILGIAHLHCTKRSAVQVSLTLAMTLLMTSCSALDALDDMYATYTPVPPTETAVPTPTIDWFPPSATPSPEVLITRAPTPEMRPDVGSIILSDDFSDSALWDVATSDLGSASINQDRLNLAAQSTVFIMSLRHETSLSDFYAEITATLNLCRNEDSYGVLIRANAAAGYRFGLSCNGMISADRVSGKSRAILQEPLPSGDAPTGAGEVRIGVWAVGKEMRLFLNGRYQFSVTSANYPTGSIGVFVNSAGDTPVVVSFSDLTIREIR